MATTTPRGIRLNNPLNIRKSSNKWDGKVIPSSDEEFEEFATIVHGIRAAIKIVQTYVRKHGCRTIEDIIKRWAPPSENNTKRYIDFVEARTGINRYNEIDITDKREVAAILQAMTIIEVGRELPILVYYHAFDMI